MPLRLRKADETFDLSLGAIDGHEPTILVGRYLSHGDVVRLNAACTKRGVIDAEALEWATWRAALVGWRNILDADGKQVPFAADQVQRVAEALPPDVAQLFTRKAREAAWEFHEAAGN